MGLRPAGSVSGRLERRLVGMRNRGGGQPNRTTAGRRRVLLGAPSLITVAATLLLAATPPAGAQGGPPFDPIQRPPVDPSDDGSEDDSGEYGTPGDENGADGELAIAAVPIALPVDGPHDFSNDWHAPRDGGARLHLGIDIFAERHTPVVATVSGLITTVRHSNEGLSGNMVVLRGDDGYRYYYIHLNNDSPGTDDDLNLAEHAFAAGIAEGVRVEAGDPIGFVGDSGNAEDTSPHLHFEIRAPSGQQINPYPSLVAANARVEGVSVVYQQLPLTGPKGSGLPAAALLLLLTGASALFVAALWNWHVASLNVVPSGSGDRGGRPRRHSGTAWLLAAAVLALLIRPGRRARG